MAVEITNKRTGGDVKYTDTTYEATGTYQINPDTSKVTSLSLSVNKKDDGYMGNANAYLDNNELKFNFSSVPYMEMATVAIAVSKCVDEIEKAEETPV